MTVFARSRTDLDLIEPGRAYRHEVKLHVEVDLLQHGLLPRIH